MYCSFLYISKVYGFSYDRPETSDVITSSSTIHSTYTKKGDQAINQQDEVECYSSSHPPVLVIYAFVNGHYIRDLLAFLFCIFRTSFCNISAAVINYVFKRRGDLNKNKK
jgi:hypothetical protein